MFSTFYTKSNHFHNLINLVQCYFTNMLTCYMVGENAKQRSLNATQNAPFEFYFTCKFVGPKKSRHCLRELAY